MNGSLAKSQWDARHPAQRYRDFNAALYQQGVPPTINESMIAAILEALGYHIQRTCSDPAYSSAFLAKPLIRHGATAAAAVEITLAFPAQVAV